VVEKSLVVGKSSAVVVGEIDAHCRMFHHPAPPPGRDKSAPTHGVARHGSHVGEAETHGWRIEEGEGETSIHKERRVSSKDRGGRDAEP
jgi:hypothetical protein